METTPLPAQPVLGVIVPCRNEAAVIGRRLANLALAEWPQARTPHRVVVVDDHSEDGTPGLAQRAFPAEAGPFVVDVRANTHGVGKAAAIRSGLAALAGTCDLVVLTDADVVCEPGALAALARAFADEPELGMACGAQRFVRDLSADGRALAADGGPVRDAAGTYDRWTARVRALESCAGRLFSVHGQLLAWRADLGLEPRGLAADDLDLMAQARAHGARVRLIGASRFLEVKPPAGPEREAQALRRARAFAQFARSGSVRAGDSGGEGALAAAQACAYRWLPLAAPWMGAGAALFAPLAVAAAYGPWGGALAALALAAAAATPHGRRLVRLLITIARAGREERRAPLSDRWETAR